MRPERGERRPPVRGTCAHGDQGPGDPGGEQAVAARPLIQPGVARGRADRAAITWSTSITTEAATAVASTLRDVPSVSGATTAAAIAARWNESL